MAARIKHMSFFKNMIQNPVLVGPCGKFLAPIFARNPGYYTLNLMNVFILNTQNLDWLHRVQFNHGIQTDVERILPAPYLIFDSCNLFLFYTYSVLQMHLASLTY